VTAAKQMSINQVRLYVHSSLLVKFDKELMLNVPVC
jgi:hypothetical protein